MDKPAGASGRLGVSGRAMLNALVKGTTDPNVLADLARGRQRKKIPAPQQALRGRFDRTRSAPTSSTFRATPTGRSS
ncbi:MAG: hypothetical protein LC790_14500 [Actinobacteria bacterium]|nr:hypothetical protein [Actinomycetota bacterium]